MIQVNELRIGNWVNLIALDQKIKIKSVSKTDGLAGLFTWVHKKEEYEDSLSGIEPIHLTPEILEDFGFNVQIGNKNLFFLNEFRYSLKQKEISLLRKCDKAGESQEHNCGFPFLTDKIKVEYLHQLQNLYFALTGTELEYNSVSHLSEGERGD